MQHFKTYQTFTDSEIEYRLLSLNEGNMRSFLDYIVDKVKKAGDPNELIERILKRTLEVKKDVLKYVVAALLLITPLNFITKSNAFSNAEKITLQKQIEESEKELEMKRISMLEEKKLLDTLAYKESSNDWTACNKYGYIGKYQFGEIALLDIYDDVKLKYYTTLKGNRRQKVKKLLKEFRNIARNSKLDIETKKDELRKIFPENEQERAARAIIKRNEKYLRNYKKYIGQNINNIKITWSGMIAAAHLRGAKSVKIYLDSNGENNLKDGYGTSVEDYLKMFK